MEEGIQILLSLGRSKCSLCSKTLEELEGLMLQVCLHPFCLNCLKIVIESSGEYQIKCPAYLDDNQGCSGYMLLREIKAVVSSAVFEEYCVKAGHTVGTGSVHQTIDIDFLESTHNVSELTEVKPNPHAASSSKSLSYLSQGEKTYLNIKLCEEPTQCGFCCQNLNGWDGIMLQTCLDMKHIFCRDCVNTMIQASDGTEIKCPLSEQTRCRGFLLEREIKSISTPEVYEAYLNKSVTMAQKEMTNIFHCQTKGCPSLCEIEYTSRKVFLCPICNMKNCLLCKAIHDGLECDQYQQILKENGTDVAVSQDLISKSRKEGFDQLSDKIAEMVKPNSNAAAQSDPVETKHYFPYADVLEIMEQMNLMPTSKEFECPICLIDVNDGIVLPSCLHMFCRECLQQTIQHSDELEVKCPYIDGNFSCVSYLKPREIKALLTSEQHETFLNRALKLAEGAIANSFHCKTVDCKGWCEIENEEAEKFTCFICLKQNCVKCKAIHENVSCEDYQNQLVQNENDVASQDALNDLVRSGEGMRCPKCQVVVQKVAGCDYIKCTCCGMEICWATRGPRWGPLGVGDITGGCRCKLNGNRCAPNCMNCH